MTISKYNVATACNKPYSITLAKEFLRGSDVGICPVISFPAGNYTTSIKCAEADEASRPLVLTSKWKLTWEEIQAVNRIATYNGAILKVIFKNGYLSAAEIAQLCHVYTDLKVAFVKTSTGYGFVKQQDGSYNYKGATVEHLKLMRKELGNNVQIEAAGGVRTLDDLIQVRRLGVKRVGATTTIRYT
ncbi:hypothetical protein GJ744_002966 [Endocarpon pusillum]|uniref:2-deoxy-D-ribose 5-phosphate aldolase n=1 Tax=Endocarpon pusillum TaxID=364733 RepID=A0A8H7ABA1_9EURO|nr:hypothetical protein GJ744_002966 [Endocarpon pusillum]